MSRNLFTFYLYFLYNLIMALLSRKMCAVNNILFYNKLGFFGGLHISKYYLSYKTQRAVTYQDFAQFLVYLTKVFCLTHSVA